MIELDKSYELAIVKMVVNDYLDEITSVTEENLNTLDSTRDQFVWDCGKEIL